MTKGRFVTILAFALLAILARADVLKHKDGRRIEGTITSERDGRIKIKTEFGELEFSRADIVSIERGKTRWQEFEEREKACKTAEDFYQLGLWAQSKQLAKETKRCMKRAIELDPAHALAHQFFGHVQYKGEWMTPEERDLRAQKDEIADKEKSGLVLHQGRWITLEEKAHLDKNEVLVDGQWIPFADAQRRQGLEEFEGRWIPRCEALARSNAAEIEKQAGVTFQELATDDALLVGPQTPEELALIAGLMKTGRGWFDTTFQSPPGLELFGGRLAEFYMFATDESYLSTCDHLTTRSKTWMRDWAELVKTTQGFMYADPIPTSSARAGTRGLEALRGHDLHHFGHLLVQRLGSERRLLPPWYEEGVAALFEFRSQGRNAVFCEAPKPADTSAPTTGGLRGHVPISNRAWITFDEVALHDGGWRKALAARLADVVPFGTLAELEFHALQPADIAASMGIIAWLESRGAGSLRKFHDVLRKNAPYSGRRLLPSRAERDRAYDEAFQAAAGLGQDEADRAWRQWVGQN